MEYNPNYNAVKKIELYGDINLIHKDSIVAMCSLCGGGSDCSCGSCGICNCGSCTIDDRVSTVPIEDWI